MRRIISALAALCLAVTALFPAFAETAQAAEKKVVNWDEARQKQFADAGFAGELKAFGPSGVSVIIPNDYTQAGLTDESAAAGTLAAFAKADGSMIAIAQTKPVGIDFHSMDDVETSARQGDPNGNFQRAIVNGLDVLIYIIPEKDVSTIMTLLDNGEMFTVTCTNLSANKDLCSFVASSLQIRK